MTWTLSNLCRNKNPPPAFEAMQQVPAVHDNLVSGLADFPLSIPSPSSPSALPPLPLFSLCSPSLISLHCYSLPPPPSSSQVLPALAHLIHHNDREVVSDTCWALSYLTDATTERIQAVLDADILTRLVQLLGSSEISCVVSASVSGRGFPVDYWQKVLRFPSSLLAEGSQVPQ